jgi:CBS domain-containing protein
MEIVNRSPLTVNSATSVAEAIYFMSRSIWAGEGELFSELSQLQPSSCVIVTECGNLLGILTERDIVRLTADQRDLSHTLVSEVMTQELVTLTESNSHTALTALALFSQHRIRHLPIVDDHGRLLGLLTPEIVRQVLQPANLLKLRLVEEVMTVEVIHAPATAMVLSIAQQMSDRRVSCIVIAEEICGAEDSAPIQQRPIGMITERDIVQYQSLEIDPTRQLKL